MSKITPSNYYDNYAFYDENRTDVSLNQHQLQPFGREVAVKVTDVQLAYGRHRVLTGINMTVPAKQIYGLLGPSGCGEFFQIDLVKIQIN